MTSTTVAITDTNRGATPRTWLPSACEYAVPWFGGGARSNIDAVDTEHAQESHPCGPSHVHLDPRRRNVQVVINDAIAGKMGGGGGAGGVGIEAHGRGIRGPVCRLIELHRPGGR